MGSGVNATETKMGWHDHRGHKPADIPNGDGAKKDQQ